MNAETKAVTGTRRGRAAVEIIDLQRDGSTSRSLLRESVELNINLACFHCARLKVYRHRRR